MRSERFTFPNATGEQLAATLWRVLQFAREAMP
jgi:hypothetical protein